MKKLKEIKNELVKKVYSEIENFDCLHTEELGEVIDMIKDLSEAIYYCFIVEAMENGDNTTAVAVAHETKNSTVHHVVE